ncbi:protein argonaute-2-like isoform X2 [Cylas formicarius]|uniref:protein argonaute-2-like isoform X2 n=1 Tax=Cylas formicarius TaxID=197179 RepID=UPI00295860DB|nr:protein argonaute-2-like isoform X2 [Cylas formicarius]
MGKSKGKKKAGQSLPTEGTPPEQSTSRPVQSVGPSQLGQGRSIQQDPSQEGLRASQGTQPVHVSPEHGQGSWRQQEPQEVPVQVQTLQGGRGQHWGQGRGAGQGRAQTKGRGHEQPRYFSQDQPVGQDVYSQAPGGQPQQFMPTQRGRGQGMGQGRGRGQGQGHEQPGHFSQHQPVGYGQAPDGQPQQFMPTQRGRGRGMGQARGRGQGQGHEQPGHFSQHQPVGYGQAPDGQPQQFMPTQRGRGRGMGQARGGGQGQGYKQPGHFSQHQPVGDDVYSQTPGGQPPQLVETQLIQERGQERGIGQDQWHEQPGRLQTPPQPQTQPAAQAGDQVEAIKKTTEGMANVKLAASDDSAVVSKVKIAPGRQGRIIKVESNHLQLSLGNLKEVFHYDVSIQPDTPKKFMRPVVELFRRKRFPNRYPAYDGRKNMITSFMLSNNIYDIIEDVIDITEEDGRTKTFKIEVKYANTVDLTPLRNLDKSPVTPQLALQCIDIILRSAPVATCLPVGRSFFIKPNQIIDLGQGMEMYHGFYQSAIRGWKPLLNVDVAHKAFPKAIRAIDALGELLSTGRQEVRVDNLRGLDRYQTETLDKFIKTLRINYEIPGHPGTKRGYRVNGTDKPPSMAKFKHQERTMTIEEYFRTVKNYKLRYPDLPTLWVGSHQRADKILLPLELCTIVEGQALNRKMTEMQTSKMIRYAATDTGTRKSKIMNGLQRANYNNNACVREFGISVGSEFQKLDARVLMPPGLQYAQSRVQPRRGVWHNDKFLTPMVIGKWTIASVVPRYGPRPDDLKRMADMLFKAASQVGMRFGTAAQEPFVSVQPRQDLQSIINFFKGQKDKDFSVIFVVVPDSGPQYSFVKQAAELNVGCLTQCIKSGTVGRRMNPQTALNILLKVNSKLNGVNHSLAEAPPVMRRPVMIMGADVTHPGPDATTIPSVAAVTASHDPKAFQYNICWRLQSPRTEIIEDLEAIVIEQLKFFYNKTKHKPEAIVFFRDGVSEGQFEQVQNAEIRAIRSACKKVQQQDYEPKITFVVVQKRHHTRLFPLDPRDSEDKNTNVPAGTCVDTVITHPFMQDFYLVSHASIQGVAKPTKYCTLWDDNHLDNDQVEQLAYYLCHMFTRCNRSVSYPAPTYYAHLAAARAKVYIENDRLNMNALRKEFERYQIKDEIRKDLPMFFV